MAECYSVVGIYTTCCLSTHLSMGIWIVFSLHTIMHSDKNNVVKWALFSILLDTYCIHLFSVTVIKYLDRGNLGKKLLIVPKGIQTIAMVKPWQQECEVGPPVRKESDHILSSHTGSREGENRKFQGPPQWPTSSSKALPPQDFTTFPNGSIIWGPSVHNTSLLGTFHIQTKTDT